MPPASTRSGAPCSCSRCVPEHAELYLLLSMTVPIPWLERVPTYKEQIEQLSEKDLSTLGFLGYPLLQTADVIIYDAQYVPVGEDQVPHLELSREIVRRFHNFYGRALRRAAAAADADPAPARASTTERCRRATATRSISSDDAETVRKKVMADVHRSEENACRTFREPSKGIRCSSTTTRSIPTRRKSTI